MLNEQCHTLMPAGVLRALVFLRNDFTVLALKVDTGLYY